tara:strand:- start:4842 stop:6602 length:1761 start_codon:yes stop_codon:yes gene_type:complete
MNKIWHTLKLKAIRGTLLANFLWTLLSLSIGYLIMHIGLEDRMTDYVLKDLKENVHFIAKPFQNKSLGYVVDWCKHIDRNHGKRFSVIDSEGIVLCDNYADVDDLVNHSDRPEFIEALKTGNGESTRSSSSIDKRMLYATVRLTDLDTGSPYILRIASAQGELAYYLTKMRSLVLKNLIAVLLILSLIFILSSLRVGRPLRRLESKLSQFQADPALDSRSNVQTIDEWEKVDLSVDKIHQELENKIQEVETSNEKISTIVDSIADGVIAIDDQEQIILTNKNFNKLINPNDIFEYQGRTLIDVIRNVDIRSALKTVLEGGSPISLQVSLNKKNYQLRVYPLLKQLGAVAIFHDMSEEQMVQQMREDFVANVSHEVRTPLTALKGFSQILSQLEPTDSHLVKPYIEKIETNVDRLTALFQDILSLSVLESRQNISSTNIDLQDLVHTIISNLKVNYASKDLQFLLDLSTHNIFGDAVLVEQILTNLLDNACKYSPTGSLVKIKSFELQSNSIVQVIDQGPGIPEPALARVFERFYRVDESRARAVGGTGLGLAIVKHAVQKHLGKVKVWNNENSGSTFEVSLPMANQ